MTDSSIFMEIAKSLLNEIKKSKIIGIGSGRTVSEFLDNMSLICKTENKYIPSSYQILFKLKENGFEIADTIIANKIDLYIDSVDQIEDKSFFSIKGGGGALLKEKILMHNSKKTIFLVQSKKFVSRLGVNCPLPIEVSPFAVNFVSNYLKKINGIPEIRKDTRGFPIFTENGNIILDTTFKEITDPPSLEKEIKLQAGVIEVGLFTKKPSKIYLIDNNTFKIIDLDY
ncbi:MAG: ribose 5-phosphate isomerase A [Nitrososphaeria archaeon]